MPETTKQAVDFFEKSETLMTNLHIRWLDEHEYEDIKDYQVPLNKVAEECGVVIVKMNKRPFGCTFTVEDKVFILICKINSYAYKRIS